MKKIIYSLIGAVFLFSACEDRLNIGQEGVVPFESFYRTDDDAQNALNNLYQSFCLSTIGNEGTYVALPALFNEPGGDMLTVGNYYGDNDFGAQLNESRLDSQNGVVENAYWGLYGVIYDCNLILDSIESTTAVRKRVCTEARALRAWAHLILAIGWDYPPLIDHILPADAKPGNYEGGHGKLLERCATEAEAVVNDLDERTSPTDKVGASKITRGFALTLAGKARLFKGDYAGARTNLKQVIGSRKYELVPTERWVSLFHTSDDLCEEMIFRVSVVQNANISDWSNNIQRTGWMLIQFWNWRTGKLASQPSFIGVDDRGDHAIRADSAKRMLANDGDSPRRKATFLTPDEFLYEMEWNGSKDTGGNYIEHTRGELEVPNQTGIKDPGGLYGFEGYFANKFIARKGDNAKGNWGFRNLTIFRYAEVLLMYAKACVQIDDSDGLGLKCLQDIQNRVGSAYAPTQLALDEVKKEKGLEIWLEGVRFPDMVCWGDADGVVDDGKRIPSTYDAFFSKKESKHRIYVEYSNPNSGPTGFIKGKHEYFPFPFDEISINPNLE